MRVRSASDLVYTAIAWLPLLAVATGVVWILMVGVLQLEVRSFGSEFFIGNHETTNLPHELQIGGPSTEERMLAALNSGDTAQMAAALGEVDARSVAAPAAATAG